MVKTAVVTETIVEYILARVPKGGMSHVVKQRQRFDQIFVEPSRHRPSVRAMEATSMVWVRRVRW